MPAPDTYDLLTGQEQSNPAIGRNLVKVQRNKVNRYCIIILATHMRGNTAGVRRHEGKKSEDRRGDGQAARTALEEKFPAISNATRLELLEELAKTNMK